MITCDAARDLLLEVELAELRGEGDGELARHVRACPRCGQRAAVLLAETQLLQHTLDAQRPPLKAAGAPHPARRPAPRSVAGWRLLVPLALAAGVAALLLVRRQQMSPPRTIPPQLAMATQPGLDVQVPAGQSVAVFQTANPNVVVIWSY